LSVAEIFQNTFSSALEGLDGIRNISYDIIVFGGAFLIAATFFGSGDIPCAPKI
jgi:hypothetical protein